MLPLQASKAATIAPAAAIWTRDEILMKRTWPCERMKNSRSGNQVRRRRPNPPAVTCIGKSPSLIVSVPHFARHRWLTKSNPGVVNPGEPSANRDESLQHCESFCRDRELIV